MTEKQFRLADTSEITKRRKEFNEFVERMFDEEDRPFFVSDEACLYDIHAGDDDKLSERCKKWYGRKLTKQDFVIRIWKLLDALHHSETE